MSGRGRSKRELVLSKSEFEQLKAPAMRRKTAQALGLRARVVLACAEGMDNKTVAAKLQLTQQTVSKRRARFVADRVDGLLDAPRPGAHRTMETRMSTRLVRWLNQVERWFATLTERYLRRGTHRSTRQLDDAIRHYLDVYNAHSQPFIWSRLADEILASLERLCVRVQMAAG
ncbi:transposase [Paraburkholderia sp. WC7.3g]|uniref:helix-turn-helix domain-containing protein n=1 Tax=Paraburkholderia sp. WC7.3g TaxID=2991070 RepID=UPI003D1AD236